jgi:hypothetical protein
MNLRSLGLARGAGCAALVVAAIAGEQQPAAGEDVMVVSPDIIAFYNGEYRRLKPPRAIAVAADGLHLGYSYCPEYRCKPNPSARSLAMQACVKAGGQGCRLFAVNDEILVSYRTMDVPDRPATTARTDEPSSQLPCAGKAREQCQKIAADFAAQRKEIEAKWAAIIERQRRFYCTGYGASPPCMVVKQAEADRAAELSALDAEMQRRLTE